MERIPGASFHDLPLDPAATLDSAGEVSRLIEAGKCKRAVELAKLEHKRSNTPQSERQLVQAYRARIEQFQSKGMIEEAETVLALVRQRFPGERDGLTRLEVQGAAAGGRVSALVAPLVNGAITPERRACIEAAIRQHLIDLRGLAGCDALPAEHSLRLAAAACWGALEAVTTGPVSEEQIALPEVSRRSPLIGWKMLARAIAAFYRHDDAGCSRALDAIPPDAAVGRLASVLRATAEHTPVPGSKAAALRARVAGDDQPLRNALEGVERAFRRRDLSGLKRSTREALRACSASRPELYERLRQHISIACVLQDVPVDDVVGVMGHSRKDAYFWRLFARASESEGMVTTAALFWERFLRHAIREGIIAEHGLEAAMVYLHAANLLRGISLAELREVGRRFSELNVICSYYEGQPAEIAALAPRSDAQVVERVMSPGWLFERAAEIHSDADTFRQWWSWADEIELPDRWKEGIARRWHEKQPGDPGPLLMLSMLAERRNALKLAIKHLAAAEELDSLNPQVRRARVRLTLATTWRHFKDRKPNLVERDLADLASLPGMGEGDRVGFVAALRAAGHALRGDALAARTDAEAVVATIGALAGGVILESVARAARLPASAPWPAVTWPTLPDRHEVVRAEARAIRLAVDLGLQTARPAAWDAIINEVLRERGCPLGHAELLTIGLAAARRPHAEQAYLASSAGLATRSTPAVTARFLLVRAQALTAPWGQRRAAQCLRAALKLARQTHDPELLREILAEIDRRPGARHQLASVESGQDMGDEMLADVLGNERDARQFPRDGASADRHLVLIEQERAGGGPPGDFPLRDDEDDREDGDVGDFNPRNLSPPLEDLGPERVRELLEVLQNRKGGFPDPEELLRTNPKLLMQLLAAMGLGPGKGDLEELMDDAEDEPPPSLFGSLFGRKRKKPRQRK